MINNLSIIVSVYNRPKMIVKTINSILESSYKAFELIIIDDGSTDSTKEVIHNFSDSRINYYYQKHSNTSIAINNGISKAKSKNLMIIDSDDYISSNYLEEIIKFSEQNEGFDYYYPKIYTNIDKNDGYINQKSFKKYSNSEEVIYDLFLHSFLTIPRGGCLIKKKVFENSNLFYDTFNGADYLFLVENALKIKFKQFNNEKFSFFYRQHNGGISLELEKKLYIKEKAVRYMIDKYYPEILFPAYKFLNNKDKNKYYYEYLISVLERKKNFFGKTFNSIIEELKVRKENYSFNEKVL